MRRTIAAAVLLSLCSLAPAFAGAQEAEAWHGVVDLSGAGGTELEFFVTFTVDGDAPSALLSIPAQGARDLPVVDVVYTADRIEFTLAAAGAAFAADRSGDSATGTLTQGSEFPMTMSRAEEGGSEPQRPQTPQPPFPYTARDVSYTNPVDGNTLAGTLTLPATDGPHPVALLITGSGGQDRDETIFDHKPFLVVADYLSRRGVAVLRVDDRGIGGSDGARADLTSEDFAGDVAAGVAYLRSLPEIDGARVGLIGHSEGGLIGPMVAAEDPAVAFVVMLAGPGVVGLDVIKVQNEKLLLAAGLPQAAVAAQVEVQMPLWQAMASGADAAVIEERLTAVLTKQLESLPEEQRAAAWDSAYAAARVQALSPWMQFFMATDPAPYLERVQAPVLALNGTLDLQVDAEQNLPAIASALERGGNADVTIQRMDQLNHLFQRATTGQVSEYATIEETFAPEALEAIATWLVARVGGA